MKYPELIAAGLVVAVLWLALGVALATAAPPGLAPGESDTYTFEAPAGSSDLVGVATWTKPGKIDPAKDLSVDVTSPGGTTFHFDDENSGAQTFIIFGPLEAGDYTIVVTNVGEKAVKYGVEFGATVAGP